MSGPVEYITVTIPAMEPEYRFEIALSDHEMDKLRCEYLLGFRFEKGKYRFLKDLADVLAEGILQELEKLTK